MTRSLVLGRSARVALLAVIVFAFLSVHSIAYPVIDSKPSDPNKPAIGCVLPVSGKNELIGRRVLRGIITASLPFIPSSRVELVVMDFGQSDTRLRASFSRIGKLDNVSLVIGPILTSSVEKALGAIARAKVPTIVFPLSERDFLGNPYVVRYGYTLEKQARVLAQFAIRDLKANKFAVIYPDTKPGRILKGAFTDTVKVLHGRVGYVKTFSAFMANFEDEVLWLQSMKPDAIFIPHSAKYSADIIGRLRQVEELRGTIFLGPDTWNSRTFVKGVGEETRGIYFTDFFFPQSPRWISFRDRFVESFGEEPGFLEYEAYEATSIATDVLRGYNPRGSKDFIERLASKGSTPWYEAKRDMSGGLTILPKPYILMIERGEIRRVALPSHQ